MGELKKSAERDKILNRLSSNMKRFEKEVALKRIHNKHEYDKEQIIRNIQEKQEYVETVQDQKVKLNRKRKEISEQVYKEKLDIMGKFDKILKKNRGVAPEDIKQLFPDDKELYEKILSIREKSLEKSSLASK